MDAATADFIQFDFATLPARDRYKLLVSTILPRPIAWVVTQSATGLVNAAPYSFFNAVGGEPPLVSISIESRADGTRKDTAANIRQSGQFVINLVDHAVAPAMVATATDVAPDISEIDMAALAVAPCGEPGRLRVRTIPNRRTAAGARPGPRPGRVHACGRRRGAGRRPLLYRYAEARHDRPDARRRLV